MPMKRPLALVGTIAVTVGVLAGTLMVPFASASSHREAPAISKDPSADNTDVYAFVSPDKPDTVTLVANYIPAEEPSGRPNFYEWDPSVLYEIHIHNGNGTNDEITYQFEFSRNGEAVARGQVSTVCCRVLADHRLESVEIPAALRERLAPPENDERSTKPQ